MPHFYKGYDKYLDLTEDEYWEQQAENYYGEDEPDAQTLADADDALILLEGEPNEDAYLPGIPDYDIFNRPSWGTEE